MLIIASVVMLVVSFVMALLSLRKELKKPKESHLAKKEMTKEKDFYLRD